MGPVSSLLLTQHTPDFAVEVRPARRPLCTVRLSPLSCGDAVPRWLCWCHGRHGVVCQCCIYSEAIWPWLLWCLASGLFLYSCSENKKNIYISVFNYFKILQQNKKQILYPLNKYMNPCNRFYSYRAISSKSGILLLLRKRLIKKKNIALITPPRHFKGTLTSFLLISRRFICHSRTFIFIAEYIWCNA